MSVMSMTGFARVDGADVGASWYWELRSVNGRGLDVRLRLPPGSERLELQARELVGKRLTRGNVNLQLMQRRTVNATKLALNEEALEQILKVGEKLRKRLGAPAPTIEGLLGLRGVLEAVEVEESEDLLTARVEAQLGDLALGLTKLVEARAGEGVRLGRLVDGQVSRIADLIEAVENSPARSAEAIASRLREQVRRITNDVSAGSLDPSRLHQEAVLLAAKADIEEELQRLRAHVAAARELLDSETAIGRRLDFLSQEFNREANTLCSKSNDADVTKIGLELKTTIEQMREQVQNIE